MHVLSMTSEEFTALFKHAMTTEVGTSTERVVKALGLDPTGMQVRRVPWGSVEFGEPCLIIHEEHVPVTTTPR